MIRQICSINIKNIGIGGCMNKYFDENIKIFDLTEKYPEVLDYLVSLGFTPLLNPAARNSVAKMVSLAKVCNMKKLDYATLESQLIRIIEDSSSDVDITLKTSDDKAFDKKDVDFYMSALLPCPIRLSIMEAFGADEDLAELRSKSRFNMGAASQGTAHFGVDFKKDVSQWADAMVSVGYDTFYSKNMQETLFVENDYMFEHPELSAFYGGGQVDLKDDKGRYFVFSYVPCIFLVNNAEIGDRELKTWDDLLKPEFENSISIPLGDLDMLNTVCLNIYKKHGIEGIKKLQKANKKSLHPSQMVMSHRDVAPPAVSIIPYFFANAAKDNKSVTVVWPEDGAYMSPIFMVARGEKQAEINEFFKFLQKPNLQELFSANGKFPLTMAGCTQELNDNQPLQWLGWDFINNNDIEMIIKECERYFV